MGRVLCRLKVLFLWVAEERTEMAAERLSMRRVREILRYRFAEGLGHKAISYRVGAAPSTVRETLRRAEAAGLSWPFSEEVSDAVLEAALYKAAGTKTGHRRAPEPDWAEVHRVNQRPKLALLYSASFGQALLTDCHPPAVMRSRVRSSLRDERHGSPSMGSGERGGTI